MYAHLVDAHQRVALAVVAAGGDPEVVWQSRARLDEALTADPAGRAVHPDQLALRVALGVG